ncbi:DUF305 domain-containing protein [Gordonia hankookensis]|uniref:DUF305 domain-containing protein n=1 Tax=Gordonia hankookensis TaxID=589403 RepID=A0ABR7WE73_9ACTN|nr:DUF305 domain-containing protein [Gordonia hankookensis]MBD1320836.1 DUF305 domain-containing protein [Gordonia hankookensis]
MSDRRAEADATDHPAPGPTGSRRTLLTTLGVVAALLIGMALGLLIAAMLHSDDMQAEETPSADSAAVGFAQDMIRHHEQGVEMATTELENGTDPQVRSMAFDILTAQSNEIGQMQSWLTRWGYPLINPHPPMTWMGHEMAAGTPAPSTPTDHNHGDHAGHDMGTMPTAAMPPGDMPSGSTTTGTDIPPMPGMATTAEMDRLRSLRAAAADVYFLQLMLRHHEGGLPMMEYAANPAEVSEDYVRTLATTMKQTQDKDIAVIEQMLAERGAEPLPMN